MSRLRPQPRSRYPHFTPFQTRWMDNDVYGHVNNVTYYSYFDTVVNRFLVEQGVLGTEQNNVIGLVVETGCQYFAPISFPDHLEIGLRVARIGYSSVHYELGVFKEGDTESRATGHFKHVYVDPDSRRPTSLPTLLQAALQKLT